MLANTRLPLAIVAAGLVCAASAVAQDDAAEVREPPPAPAADGFDRTPVDCVATTNIETTEVLDDRTILFHMRGREAYRNYLPRRCPGLGDNERFSYRVSASQLCSIDTITVIELGSSIAGFTCRLGPFYPVSEEEIEDLRLMSEQRGGNTRVESEPVERPADP